MLNQNLLGTYCHEDVARVCQILIKIRSGKISVQFTVLRSKPLCSTVSLKHARLPFLTGHCKSQCEGCQPRSTADGLGKAHLQTAWCEYIKNREKRNWTFFFGWEQLSPKRSLIPGTSNWRKDWSVVLHTVWFEELRKHPIMHSFWGLYKTDSPSQHKGMCYRVAKIRKKETATTQKACPVPKVRASNGIISFPAARYTPATAAPVQRFKCVKKWEGA